MDNNEKGKKPARWRFGRFMKNVFRHAVETPDAPAAIGPYSQGVFVPLYGAFLFFSSGQIPLVPESGQLVEGGIVEQTTRVLDNLEAILKEEGLSWKHVVKTTVFMTDLADFAAMNAVYEERLAPNKPARSAVQVAALPKGAMIEIELIAVPG